MNARADKVATVGNEAAKAGTEAMLEELVAVTPVDESTALSNWQIGVGAPVNEALPAWAVGSHGSTRGASAEATIDEGKALLSQKEPGEDVFLSNLTPYIVDLDSGSSTQFAGGFVSRALIVFSAAAKAAVANILK